MALAVVLVLLVIGTVAFHLLNPWWFTPIASNWGLMDDTVRLTFWVTGAVFIAVNLFMAYTIVRYRHRKGREQRAEYEPEYKRLEWWLTGITTVGVAAMLAPGLFVWAKFVTVPDDAKTVEALGQQWAWSFRLPGQDGVLGAVDSSLVSADNPFGMDANDPKGHDDVLIAGPELHLPLGQAVKVLLRSKDVLHDFTVPQFRVKMDLVPGMITYLWFTPTRTGPFEILCEEMCGLGHFAMRGRVVVNTPEEYQAWLGHQPTYQQILSRRKPDVVAGQALYQVCSACHGADALGNPATNAPKLAGQPAWYLARQLHNFQAGLRGGAPGDPIAAQMRAIALTLDDDKIDDVVAHIGTLQHAATPTTIHGDAARGKRLFTTCAYCHGAEAQGVWGTNAPRLAGMSDWYLARQLKNFQHGLRGRDPQDYYGAQMALVSRSVATDPAIDDLVSYINSLQ
ncbi:MAG TPA: c-type cytochrome [Steroidobacteraceae bacterium]